MGKKTIKGKRVKRKIERLTGEGRGLVEHFITSSHASSFKPDGWSSCVRAVTCYDSQRYIGLFEFSNWDPVPAL